MGNNYKICINSRYWSTSVQECVYYSIINKHDIEYSVIMDIRYGEYRSFNKQFSVLLRIPEYDLSLSLLPYITIYFERKKSTNWETTIRLADPLNHIEFTQSYGLPIPGNFTWYIIPSIDHENKTFYIDMYKYKYGIANPNYYYNSIKNKKLNQQDLDHNYKYTKSHIHQLIDQTSLHTNISSHTSINLVNEEDVYVYDMLLSLFEIY